MRALVEQLKSTFAETKATDIRAALAAGPKRFSSFSTSFEDMLFYYSKCAVNDKVLAGLEAIAAAGKVAEKRDAMFAGEAISITEDRAALHTTLRNRSNTPALFFVCAFAVVILSSCSQDEGATEVPKSQVRTLKVSRSDFRNTVKLTGEIAAHVQADLSFQVGGIVADWTVDVGSHVASGQLLARLDPQQQKSDVEAAQAALQAAESGVGQASAEFERRKTLLAKGSTSKAVYDQAETALRVAEGSLQNAKAQFATSQDALSYTELRSDRDGIIIERRAELGQVVRAAQAVFSIAVDGQRDAIFHVPESFLINQPDKPQVEVALVSNPSIATTGTVSEIAPSVDQTTGTVAVKLTLKTTPPEMTLGAPVTAFAAMSAQRRVVLPASSIADLGGKPAVWVVGANGTVGLRSIDVLLYDSEHVIVTNGVQPDEVVVVEGGKLLRPGQPVENVGGAE